MMSTVVARLRAPCRWMWCSRPRRRRALAPPALRTGSGPIWVRRIGSIRHSKRLSATCVRDRLTVGGVELVPQLGASGHDIDFAACHPDRPGESKDRRRDWYEYVSGRSRRIRFLGHSMLADGSGSGAVWLRVGRCW